MPHISPLSDGQAPEAAKPLLQAVQEKLGSVPNIFRTMAHKPAVLEAVLKMNAAIQDDLPAKLRELAYLKTSKVNACDYWVHYHSALGERAGLSEEQIAAMDDYANSRAFDDQEKAVLRFAEQLTKQAKVDANTMKELKGFLSESQLVVLAGSVGLANFTNRFNHAFDVALP